MSFNADQPHGEVFGVPGVKWEQAGRLYDTLERQVVIQNDMAILVAVPEKVAAPEGNGEPTEAELRLQARISGIEGVEKMNRAQLKKALGV